MGAVLLRRLLVLLLPIIFSWVSTNLLIDRPVVKWVWDKWGPTVISEATGVDVAQDPGNPATIRPNPDINIRFPGGRVIVPARGAE